MIKPTKDFLVLQSLNASEFPSERLPEIKMNSVAVFYGIPGHQNKSQ